MANAWDRWAALDVANDREARDALAAELGAGPSTRVAQARALADLARTRIRLDAHTKARLRARAALLAEKAYADNGAPAAQLALAWALIDDPARRDEATPLVLARAEDGDVEALCLRGWLRYRGQGVAKDDVGARADHLIAAAAGVAASQFELSIFFDKGIGGEVDVAAARAWEAKAAAQGHARACLNIGAWAATGRWGPIDMARAVEYYARAAAGGYVDGAQRLALMYDTGADVPPDEPLAAHWRAAAAALGFDVEATPPRPADPRLHAAVAAKDLVAVRTACADGVDLEDVDRAERTPLLIAASDGDVEIVRALLDAGADPNHFRIEVLMIAVLDTPLERARYYKHEAVVALLLERGALENDALPDPQGIMIDRTGTPAQRLSHALWDKDEERVRGALAAGADPNGSVNDGNEPALAAAVRLCRPAYVQILLDAGADPNTRDEGATGRPLLHTWVREERGAECFERLLAAGADAHVVHDGKTVAQSLPLESELRARMAQALRARGVSFG